MSEPFHDSDLPSGQPKRARARLTWPWVALLLGLASMALVGLLLWRVAVVGEHVIDAPGKAFSALVDAFRPKVNIHTVMLTTLQQLKTESKLVVLTATVNVEVTKRSGKNALWGMVDFGDTQVTLKAYDNKLQFCVPLQDIDVNRFQYDPQTRHLIFFAPHPVLDDSVVDVQSDPAKMEVRTDLGWGRLDKYSGQFIRDEARRDLRPAVIKAGHQPLIEEKAQAAAREALGRLLTPLADQLQPGVQLEIRFAEPPGKNSVASPSL